MKYAMFVVMDPDHTDADVEAAPDLDAWFDDVKGRGACRRLRAAPARHRPDGARARR